VPTRGAVATRPVGVAAEAPILENRRVPLPPPPRRTRTPRLTHLRALDGLRGVAVLAVVLFHFAPDVAPGGFLGVDLFFVLSGFLITSLLVKEWGATTRISLGSFWVRRARRLVPALLLVLAAVGVYGLLVPDPVDAQHFGVDGLSALGYVANWHFIASGQDYIEQFLQHTASPLRHMWSLAIEEQFYLVWPIVVMALAALVGRRTQRAARRRRQFRRALVTVCIVLGALSFLRMITLYEPGNLNRVYYGTDSRAFIILIGAVLGALSFGVPTAARRLRGPVVVIGCASAIGLVVAMAALTAESSWLYEGGYGLVAVAMGAVLFAAAQPGANPLARLLEHRGLVGLGLISYGVYLWHWPISLWMTHGSTGLDGVGLFVARAAATLAVALASYRFVEQPIRAGKLRRLGRGRPVLVTGAAVLSVATLLLVPALAFPSVRTAPTVAAAPAEVAAVQAGYQGAPRCDGGPELERIDPEHRLLIQLEGNSLAGEVRTCLSAILRPAGVRFETVNPPVFILCDALPDIEKQVRATRPDAGILFAFVAYDGRCGEPWHRPVDRLVEIWRAAGMHVYLVPSPPFVPGSPQQADLGEGPKQEAFYYQALAARDPEHITLLDSATFVRSDDGQFVWRMPCLPGGEAGCDASSTVGVRYVDGLHFCTDPEFSGHGCIGARYQAGERRAAASVAAGLVPSLVASRAGP